ncbi:flagellar export chaperone FlgN [Clostridium sp.]|uniref:flagellar export chaperone FlgN n=1 Tax=Clostridium sp. TaxID=1506 RepID=UPI00284A083B|nr:flagellar export chaperone FlgN [Clostridium sp.]MDR3593974.1 flagellar export chaperone FlgN [Clostridium sp.]
MINELIKLMTDQDNELRKLLELLETQYKLIMSKDAFGLDGLVDKINECGKKIAKDEVERRNLTGEQNIKDIVNKSDNEEVKELYGKIQYTLNKVILKKETNEMLLKQQIIFNNKMLQIINPNRESKIYNSYGNLSR